MQDAALVPELLAELGQNGLTSLAFRSLVAAETELQLIVEHLGHLARERFGVLPVHCQWLLTLATSSEPRREHSAQMLADLFVVHVVPPGRSVEPTCCLVIQSWASPTPSLADERYMR